MFKIFAQIMANFPVLGMRLHPHAVRLCQLARNITSIGDLIECQSFVVYVELRRLLRHQHGRRKDFSRGGGQ